MVVKSYKSRRMVKGAGIGSFFKSVWRGVKSVAKPIADLAKKTKIVSTVVAPALTAKNPALGSLVGSVANAQGYGRKRRVRRVKRGGAMLSKLKSVLKSVRPYATRLNKHLKDTKWISRELKSRGHNTLSGVASSLGYGGRKRRRTKRKVGRGVNKRSLGVGGASKVQKLKF